MLLLRVNDCRQSWNFNFEQMIVSTKNVSTHGAAQADGVCWWTIGAHVDALRPDGEEKALLALRQSKPCKWHTDGGAVILGDADNPSQTIANERTDKDVRGTKEF